MTRILLTILALTLGSVCITSAIALGCYYGLISALVTNILSFGFILTQLFATYWFQDKLAMLLFGGEVKNPAKYQPEINQISKMVADLAITINPKKPSKIAIKVCDSEMDNALATGRHGKATIIITKGLIEDWQDGLFTNDEIKILIAHEMAHITFHHSLKSLLIFPVISIAVGFFFYFCPFLLPVAPYTSALGILANDIFIPMLFQTPPILLLMIPFKNSFENTADEYGVKWTGNPLDLASALKKLSDFSSDPLQAGSIFRWQTVTSTAKQAFAHLLFPHPSIEKRIALLENMAMAQEKNRNEDTSTYLNVSKTLSKLDKVYGDKLGHWATINNTKIKREYVTQVKKTIDQALLPGSFRGLLFYRASHSQTAKAGSGLTVTRTEAKLRDYS